jgi:hypothetical protein
MNSYPQQLSTTMQKVWDTPKPTPKVATYLTEGCTLDAYNTQSISHFISENDSFTYLAKTKKQKIKWLVLIFTWCAMQGVNTAHATTTNVDLLRLHAHTKIVNFNQFLCFDKIITKESNWRINARNGSHYGLGQMRSRWYGTLNGYQQIDETIRYIKERYQTPCNAWAFHKQKNWF